MITKENLRDIVKIQRMASDLTCEDFVDAVKSHYSCRYSPDAEIMAIDFNSIIAYAYLKSGYLGGKFICYDDSREHTEGFVTEPTIFCY